MATRLFLFDDDVARCWQPFTLTRPAGEVLFGTETLRARSERVLRLKCEGHLAGDILLGFDESGAPPCLTPGMIGDTGDRLFLSSRLVPAAAVRTHYRNPTVLVAGSEPVGAWIPAGIEAPRALFAGAWPEWPRAPLDGAVLGSVWELMVANPDRIRADGDRFPDDPLPAHVHRLGGGRVALGSGAVIDPGAVLDTTNGPVILAAGAQLQAPCRVTGPVYVGPGSTVLGGAIRSSSIGPACKVRGEVESTVMLGYTNKAHDGFLGHSVVGRWVNLGAMTSNSDLKHTYGGVRLDLDGGTVDTGLTKVGCFLGDHVRTGIGTLLDTGTVIGAGSAIFDGMPPKQVPPFSWTSRGEPAEYDIERFVETAARVMARRNVELTAGMRRLYREAFSETSPLRSASRRR